MKTGSTKLQRVAVLFSGSHFFSLNKIGTPFTIPHTWSIHFTNTPCSKHRHKHSNTDTYTKHTLNSKHQLYTTLYTTLFTTAPTTHSFFIRFTQSFLSLYLHSSTLHKYKYGFLHSNRIHGHNLFPRTYATMAAKGKPITAHVARTARSIPFPVPLPPPAIPLYFSGSFVAI